MNNESNYGEDITQQTAQDIQFKALTADERLQREQELDQEDNGVCLSCSG